MSCSNDLYCITLFTTVLVRRLLLLPFFYIHVIYCVNKIMDTHIMGTRFDFFFLERAPAGAPGALPLIRAPRAPPAGAPGARPLIRTPGAPGAQGTQYAFLSLLFPWGPLMGPAGAPGARGPDRLGDTRKKNRGTLWF